MPISSSSAPLTSVTARQAMSGSIVACDPSTPLAELAGLMGRHRIHCVVVDGVREDAGGEHLVWGVVSDLDLVRAALLRDPDMTAGRVAATEAVSVDAGDDLLTVGATLVAHRCSHAIVVDRERPVGVLSTLDVVSALAG